MKEYIVREIEEGMIEEEEIIRCKDCKWFVHDDDCYGDCSNEDGAKGFIYTTDYCSRAERKETGYFTPEDREFYRKVNREKMQDTGPNIFDFIGKKKDNKVVPLHHEDIHFNSKEDEKAYYEALAERREK